MRKQRRGAQLFCLLFTSVLLVAACSSDKKSPTGAGASSSSSEVVPQGGTLVIGAEQEPDCADWFGTCGGSSWGFWMMNVNTMPRAFDVVKDSSGTYVFKAPWDPIEQAYMAFALNVLTFRGDRISDVVAFAVREIDAPREEDYHRWDTAGTDVTRLRNTFERFGLPDRIGSVA